MRCRLQGVLLADLQGSQEYHLHNQDTTAAFCKTYMIPKVVYCIAQYVFRLGLELKIVIDFNLQVHKELYDKLILEESYAFACKVVTSPES